MKEINSMTDFFMLYNFHIIIIILLVFALIAIRIKYNELYFYNNALEAFNENNYSLAKSLLLKSLNRKRSYPLAKQLLCLVYLKLEDYNTAKKYLEEIINSNPENFESIYNLALTLQMQGNDEEAKKFYKMALNIDSKDYDTYFNLGTIEFNNNNYNEAKNYFEKANAINPSISASKFYIIKCQDELCSYDNDVAEEEIIDSYLKMEGRENLPIDYYISLALACAKHGDIDKAEKYAIKSTETNPDDTKAYRLLAVIYIIKKDSINAENNISIAIQLDANNKEGYNLVRYSKFKVC